MEISKTDLQRLTAAMEEKNWSIEEVIKFIENGPTQEKVFDTKTEITLVIDYTKTIEQVIADSNYTQTNHDINNENFPISSELVGKKIEVSAKLFNFDSQYNISSEYALAEMDKAGYRPATLMELLVLGFLFPELRRQMPIIALGSLWNFHDDKCSGIYAPYMCSLESNKRLDLALFDGPWGDFFEMLIPRGTPIDRYHFMGIRK